jgi:3-deoxy-7-phosphoheptulonate synthase
MHQNKQNRLVISINDQEIIGNKLCIIAGPCAVESEEQMYLAAAELAKLNIKIMRGGAFKPRTSPYSFQGLGEDGFKIMANAAKAHNLFTISEVIDQPSLEAANEYIDILQIGSRNMQNFSLLKAVGKINKPVMLKRGSAATYKEFLLAAEYILNAGNPNVILCERGIRTFETYTRNTLDLAAVPALQELSHLPVVIDPSHGCGRASMIRPLTKAAVAVGANGVMLEAHPNPLKSISDADQAIDFTELKNIINDIL